MTAALQPVIVGAGPAGVRAAEALVDAGLRPVVIDENARWGGQIYRQPPAGHAFTRGKRTLYGFDAAKADAVHRTMAALLPHVDYRPNTLAWACGTGRIDTLQDGREVTVPFSRLIVASGATDRMLPVPGWTLAGVYTLGGAQVALKAQGCAIGRRVVFAGTGPLLYLVAYQYAKAGAQVAA
ncbi:FAD-dependent oxidoreductase, partial [Burkholderia vietnamiensis]